MLYLTNTINTINGTPTLFRELFQCVRNTYVVSNGYKFSTTTFKIIICYYMCELTQSFTFLKYENAVQMRKRAWILKVPNMSLSCGNAVDTKCLSPKLETSSLCFCHSPVYT